MERTVIEVGVSETKYASSPHVLVTRGLGSCIGIALYDPIKKIGSLSHPMLPDMHRLGENETINTAKYVNSVIPVQVENLKKEGCSIASLKAKICGGACMFHSVSKEFFVVGQKNILMAKTVLKTFNIPIVGEDVGGNYGRTILFDLLTGNITVKTILHGEKILYN